VEAGLSKLEEAGLSKLEFVMLCLSAIVVFLPSIDLVVNRRVWDPAVAGVYRDPGVCGIPVTPLLSP